MSRSLEYIRQDTRDAASFLIGSDQPGLISELKQLANGATTDTPTPSGDDDHADGGPITRITNELSPLGLGMLEHLGLHGHEIANDVQTRVAELYRNEFPVLEARFERKCIECEAEYDERVDECDDCGGDVREPDPAEKREAAQRIEQVNKEGQSLRELAKSLEWDQWFTGVPVLVIQHKYAISPQGAVSPVAVSDLVKGDPKRIVPVVDANRRIGGHWWACARCRHADDYDPSRQPGRCDYQEDCTAELREVYYAEYGDDGDDADTYYFEEEVLTFPWPFPRLHGLDGLTPVHHVWLKQLIIDFQDRYAGAFYDPESDRLPNQFIVLHTTNPDRWEDRLTEARENADDDVYDSPVFANEYSPSDGTTPEVQVVDAMPDELLGQNQELRETFKKDIRRATNISDVHDNETSDAGGLNNEGLQIEVTDRPTATQMHDYESGWLDELAKRLGIDDWRFSFIPATGPDAEDLEQEVRAGTKAEDAGLDARIVDGQVEIADGEFSPDDEGLEKVQKAGNWLKVNEGRKVLGLPPIDDTDTEEFGAPGRVGAMDAGEGGGGASPEEAGEELPLANTGDTSSHDYGPEDPLQRTPPDDLETACRTLYRAHEHMVYPDVGEQRASEPFWDEDENIPEFVQEVVQEALRRGAITTISSKLPANVTPSDVRAFFEEKLTQPQGWSLRSLTEDYTDRFDVDPEAASQAVRRQTKSVLDKGREVGYEQTADGESVFKWVGPIDDRKTDASWEVLEKTNPEHGGTPRRLDELKRIVAQARRRHFPELTGAEWADSWQDRDTFVEHYD